MGSDTIWIIGSNMTRFGKHPDKDVIDLAAEASREALKDAGISSSEVGCWESESYECRCRYRPAITKADRAN